MDLRANARHAATLLAAILLATGCGSSSPPPAPSYSAAIQEGQSAAQDMLAQGKGSAIAVALVDRDRVIWSEGFGLADRAVPTTATSSTLFSIASASKTLAAVAVMRLVDQKLVNLDAPFVQYVPEFQMLSPEYRQITVRMLLDHSSGLPGTDYRNVQTTNARVDYLQQVTSTLAGAWLKARPGETSVYCNDGFTLVEALVHSVTGKSYVEYVQQEIFTPLGMARSNFALVRQAEGTWAKVYAGGVAQPQDYLATYGSGGAWSTVDDLGRFLRMFLGRGALGGTRILSEASVDAMAVDSTVHQFHPVDSAPHAFGLGWDTVREPALAAVGERAWLKGGDAEGQHYGAAMMVAPDAGLAVAVLGTAGLGSDGATLIAERVLLRALVEAGRVAAFPQPVPPVILPSLPAPPDLLEAVSGIYAVSGGTFRLGAGPGGALRLWVGGPDETDPVHRTLAWGAPADLPYRVDGTFSADAKPLAAYHFVEAGGRWYIASRSPVWYGNALVEQVYGERLPAAAAPMLPAWTARLGRTWLLVNDAPDSISWPRTDARLGVSGVDGLDGMIAVFPRGDGPHYLDASVDEASARIVQPTGRDLDALVAFTRSRGSATEEWMRMGSFLHRPVEAVEVLPRGFTSVIDVQVPGEVEWRAIDARAAAPVTVRITGAKAWAFYGTDLQLLAHDGASGVAILPPGAGRAFLAVHGVDGQAVGVSVD